MWYSRTTIDGAALATHLLFGRSRPVPLNISTIKWRWHCCKALEEASTPGDGYVSLEEQCGSRYQIHLPGKSYSAMLKYKWLCVRQEGGGESGENPSAAADKQQ